MTVTSDEIELAILLSCRKRETSRTMTDSEVKELDRIMNNIGMLPGDELLSLMLEFRKSIGGQLVRGYY
ncbi:MAG: hypothetical protein KZQ77_17880 [Candidatus Thiodiazotropha sp. (ex Notomyrtea botanica)]|nr:hypothetical protein [Candidatus Thiodiazotropha sp. (ex Notomyrtea botanica)]